METSVYAGQWRIPNFLQETEIYRSRLYDLLGESYFDISYKSLVNFFVEQKKLSPKELKEIVEMIEGEKK